MTAPTNSLMRWSQSRLRQVSGGTLRVAIAPDPCTLKLKQWIDGVPFDDPVQRWLDTTSQGERVLEAAAPLAARVGWS